MSSRLFAPRPVILSLGTAILCQFVTVACADASPQSDTAVADLSVDYRGERLSDARLLVRLGEEVRLDTHTDDGHTAAVTLTIADAGGGAYRTSLALQYDGASIAATDVLSVSGQDVAVEQPDVKFALRVRPGA